MVWHQTDNYYAADSRRKKIEYIVIYYGRRAWL